MSGALRRAASGGLGEEAEEGEEAEDKYGQLARRLGLHKMADAAAAAMPTVRVSVQDRGGRGEGGEGGEGGGDAGEGGSRPVAPNPNPGPNTNPNPNANANPNPSACKVSR